MRLRMCIVLVSLAAAGCSPGARDSGFGDVRQKVSDRLPQRIIWRTDDDENRAADDAVNNLLRVPLTHDAAVQIALLNNRSLQATYEQLAISQADLVQAGLLSNPVFGASARFPDRSPRATNLELSVTQNFLEILLIPARKRIAANQFQAAKLRVAREVLDLAADVKETFLLVQSAQQTLELRRTVVEALELSAMTAKRLQDAGNINDLELHDHAAMYEQARIDLALAEAELAEDREKLAALMGLSAAHIDWQLPADLAELPELEIAPGGLESFALGQRLDLASARSSIQGLEQALGVRRDLRFFNDLEVGASAERETDRQWMTGPSVSIPLPVFDLGQASIARAGAELREAKFKYTALATQIRSDVRRLRAKMLAARSRAQLYRSVLIPLRHQIVQEAQLQYNGMLLGVFELLRRKQDEIDAGRQYIEALRDYWLARVELERAVGGRLPHATMPATAPTAPVTRPSAPESHQHHHEGH